MVHSAQTALDVAIGIEQRGRDFYLKAGEQAKEPKLASLLAFLAAEEERHLGLYRQILDHISGGAFQEVELVGGYGQFIKALTDEVLQSLKDMEHITNEECLAAALRFEKDTLIFFLEIKTLMKDEALKVVEQICSEEKNHILKLIDYRKKQETTPAREKIGTYT
jgi:rubrerythrin